MKKLFNLSLAFAALSIVFYFSSCANASNTPGNDVIPTTPIEVTVPTTSTSGNVTAAITDSNGNKTATLSASNGSYTFTESSNANVNPSILSRAAFVDSSKNGVWTFSETGSSIPKYSGIYYGNISQFSSIEVKLTLIINKVLDNGSLKSVTENQIFSMEATTSTFHATIPEVKVLKNEVTELALNNEEIDNKIFKNKYNSYTLFTNNTCYSGNTEYDARSLKWPQADITVIKVDEKLYKARKVTSNGNISYYSQAKDELIFHTSYKNAFTGKVFVNAEKNRIVAFKTSGQVFLFGAGLTDHVNYSVSGNTATTEPIRASPNAAPRSISYTISGTTLTSDQDKNVTLTQISGDNGFGGKAFYTSIPFEKYDDPSYSFNFPFGFFIFESNTSLIIVNLKGFNTFERTSYTVDGTTATATANGKTFNFTISGNKITATFDSKSVTSDQIL